MEIHFDLTGLSLGMDTPFRYFPSIGQAEQLWESVTTPGVLAPIAVAVPSVIVPVWNVVLYPDAPGFWDRVSLSSVERVEFDPRLFSPDAITEIA